ncbi:DNA polymerase III subunit epsilon, partial [Clavibacter phaseoli]
VGLGRIGAPRTQTVTQASAAATPPIDWA